MPFHYRLLGKDRIALYSFVHSVSTMLGQSIFEQVAVILAENRNLKAKHHFKLKGHISQAAVLKIDDIQRNLQSGANLSNKIEEIEQIKSVILEGEQGKLIEQTVDVFIEEQNTEYYFEIKTAKPNLPSFKSMKKQLLEVIALRLSTESENKIIKSLIAIPYNPYEPKPYQRWTLRGLFDLKEELLVGKEFWDLVGGEGSYEKLLDAFEKAGLELYEEIDFKMKNL